MTVAIHQPHYFPWLGYLAKMACVDQFIYMDTVQLEKRSCMIRNRIVDTDGQNNHYEREYRELRIQDFGVWTARQKGILIHAYKKCPYFDEVWNAIAPIFHTEHEFLCDVTIHSIQILRDIFRIDTPVVLQSNLEIDSSLKRGKLILGICKAVGADTYFAGRGASMQYLDVEEFEREGVRVAYQNFNHPVYGQVGNHPFVTGLSALDMLFNLGVDKARELFWDSVGKEMDL